MLQVNQIVNKFCLQDTMDDIVGKVQQHIDTLVP